MNDKAAGICKKIAATGKILAQTRLVAGTWGNISARVPGKKSLVAVTPSGRDYLGLRAKDIVLTDLTGTIYTSRFQPSSELPLHLAVYNARPDVHAIIHTHSVYASAFAVAGQPIPAVVEDLAQIAGGEVSVSAYALPGTAELAAGAVAALAGKSAALLANHGVVAVGRNLAEALATANIVEKTAMITLLARSLGAELTPLGAADLAVLRDNYLTKYSRQQLVED